MQKHLYTAWLGSSRLLGCDAPWPGRMPADSHRSASAPPRKATGHRPHRKKKHHKWDKLPVSMIPLIWFHLQSGTWFSGINHDTGRTLFLTPRTQKLPHPNGAQGYPRPTGSYPRDQILLAHWYHTIVGLANKIFKLCPCHCEPHI